MTTLDKILLSREKRVERQAQLLRQFTDKTLISLTVIFPGPEKRNDDTLTVATAAVEAVRGSFLLEFEELRDLETGYEAMFVVALPLLKVKEICCHIEDSHPLGRLMDIDVIDPVSGPVSRSAVGLPARRCLICDRPARECIRTHAHTPEEICLQIDSIMNSWRTSL